MKLHKIYELFPELEQKISHECHSFLINEDILRSYIDLWEYKHRKDFLYNYPPDTLPFRCCYFELVCDSGEDWGLIVYNFEDMLLIKPFVFHGKLKISVLGEWHFCKSTSDLNYIVNITEEVKGCPKLIFGDPKEEVLVPNEEDTLGGCVIVISQFLSIINEKNVRLKNIEPPLKLNKKRIKKKKMPFFAYKTIEIIPDFVKEPKQQTQQPKKHKSPRFHVRRAHTRRLKSGKVVNVRSANVGRIEDGIVMKDYRLSDRGLNEKHLHQH